MTGQDFSSTHANYNDYEWLVLNQMSAENTQQMTAALVK